MPEPVAKSSAYLEWVRETHVCGERWKDEVSHLDAVGRDDVTERIVVIAQELGKVMQQDEQHPQRAAVQPVFVKNE